MTRIIVCHASYGCDTGCCGHAISMNDEDRKFEFAHPSTGEDPRSFAEDLVREVFGEEHVKDLDWENCVIVDD